MRNIILTHLPKKFPYNLMDYIKKSWIKSSFGYFDGARDNIPNNE